MWSSPTRRAIRSLADRARITGSQSNTLTIARLLMSDAGNYQVIVTNAYGSVTSAVAILAVLPPAFQPSTPTGRTLNLSWSATAGSGYQVQYKTDFAQSNWINLGGPITAGGGTATVSDLMTNAQRFYRVLPLP